MTVKDWLGSDNKLGIDIWEKKYQQYIPSLGRKETFDEWLDRVSNNNEEVKQLIIDKKFLYGGRILANRGMNKYGRKITYSNCYVLSTNDSLEAIYNTAYQLARTYSYGGGVGVDLSELRPRGAEVNNAAKSTTGPLSFAEIFEKTTEVIGQEGRRGALMLSMSCEHPDIEEFVSIKEDLSKINHANMSVRFTDKFLRNAEKHRSHKQVFNVKSGARNYKIEKDIDADALIDKLAQCNWDMGEPGMLFWDTIENYNLLNNNSNFKYAGTNPCLSGDTLIAVADGRNAVAIKDLCDTTFPVYSGKYSKMRHPSECLTHDKWTPEIKSAKAFKTGTKHIITIYLSDGTYFNCTPDHRLALADGTYCEAQYCKGKQLGKFFTFSDKNSNKNYRHINSKTSYRQYRLIGEYYNILVNDSYTIHHLDHDASNDTPANLASISFSDHMKEVSKCRLDSNPITSDINYKFNQGIRNIRANGHRYNWSEEKIEEAISNYKLSHQDIYTEKIDKNVDLTSIITVVDIIDNNEVEDVFDLTVEDNHNFYIITKTDDDRYMNCSGVLVHNCAEEPLPEGGSCCLGSMNLVAFVKDGNFDYDDFANSVKIAIEAMNEVLMEGLPLHPLEVQRECVGNWRQIGLGIMGLADCLIKLNEKYGSELSILTSKQIGETLANSAAQKSAELVDKYGTYPMCPDINSVESPINSEFAKNVFTKETLDIIRQHGGLANSQLLTIAPTGTLSTMLGISGGIEPIFSNYYERTTKSLHGEDVTYKVYTPIVKEYMNNFEITSDENLPEYFITARELDPLDRVIMQSIWQQYIDASISSTVNLPEDTTPDEIKEIYMEAWRRGLKGITVFRENCKRVAILNVPGSSSSEDKITENSDDTEVELIGKRKKIQTGCGSLHILAYFNPITKRLQEIYLAKGSTGGCANFMVGLSRTISLLCRSGVDIYTIKDQLDSTGSCPSYAVRTATKKDTSRGSCCPMAVGNALVEMYEEFKKEITPISIVKKSISKQQTRDDSNDLDPDNKAYCPECGAELRHSGGCDFCNECGYSHCG